MEKRRVGRRGEPSVPVAKTDPAPRLYMFVVNYSVSTTTNMHWKKKKPRTNGVDREPLQRRFSGAEGIRTTILFTLRMAQDEKKREMNLSLKKFLCRRLGIKICDGPLGLHALLQLPCGDWGACYIVA